MMVRKAAVLVISSMLVLSSLFVMLDMTVEGKEVLPAPLFSGLGAGTVADPYQITTVDELQEMELDLGANYTLMNDIDASATTGWPNGFDPIGGDPDLFNGSLNGNDFEIIDLYISRTSEDDIGLFGRLSSSASISNTGLANIDISGRSNVGSFAGMNDGGTIINCYSTGSVYGAYNYIGGFVGEVDSGGTITNCYSTANITNGVGPENVGGFVGRIDNGMITNCYSTGTVDGNREAGGFVGEINGAISIIKNCYSTGAVSGEGRLGGFVGWSATDSTIMDCYSTGDVDSLTDDSVGGFAGLNNAYIMNSYSTGNATGTVDSVGGFVGHIEGTISMITNCYSTGNATGDGVNIGGFVGFHDGTITNSHSTGTAIGNNNHVGGFAGRTQNVITNCYSTGNATGIDWVGGFAGWNSDMITDCYSTGNATGTERVGGFAGWNEDEITNCYSTGNAIGVNYIGGFGGYNDHVITNCYSTGNATGDAAIAGFVGYNSAIGIITNSYSTGNAIHSGAVSGGLSGGFVGWNEGGTIMSCYGTGSATFIGYLSIGGFVGRHSNNGLIMNCYSTGKASGGDYVGGFVGENSATTINCYSTGNVTGTGTELGGFVGHDFATITNCFWDMDTSGRATSDGGTGKTTAEMKQLATFNPPWDFVNIWGFEPFTYPFLTPISPIITSWDIHLINVPTNEDALYSFDFDSTAQVLPSTNAITWSISANVEGWLSIDSAGLVSGTPTNIHVGTHPVSVMATDSLGSTGYFNYDLTVMNTAPSITTSDIISVVSGTLYSNDYDSTDDPSTTWSLGGNATGWLTIDNAGVLYGMPSNAEAGTYNVEVVVNDGNGGTDTQIFTLTVNLDTDGDGDPDITDLDDDNDGTPDVSDDFPLDPTEDTDTDGDGTGNNADNDDDDDGWSDTVEELAGTDPLDDTDMPSDADFDGIADFMDPDFLTTTEYNNNTVYSNNTVYNNVTVTDADSDLDGWNDIVEILADTDPQDDTDMPSDADGDDIADFMDPDFLTTTEYNNNTVYNNNTIAGDSKTPAWTWGAVVAAVVMGILAALGFMRGGKKPEVVEEAPEPEVEAEETPKEEYQGSEGSI